jgi:predicted transcriptional regulator
MGGDVDAVVVGVGSGGTLSGLGHYFQRESPKTQMILADPVGSILTHYVETGELIEAGSWTVEGIGEDFIPDNADMSLIRHAYSISDRESMETARLLLIKEGLLAGSSSGTLISAALRYCREQTTPKRVVSFVCDTGAKYLSKVYNDSWLAEQGLTDRLLHGDLRDLIVRTPSDGGAVVIGPDDTLLTAYNRMRQADVSQLPVIEDGRLVGLLDESDMLRGVENEHVKREARFRQPVRWAMTTRLRTLQVSEPMEALLPVFERDEVALILDGEQYLGLITRVDLINHLRLATERFASFTAPLIGMPVSSVWFGYGSAVFLEFGALTDRVHSNGLVGNPRGEMGLMIEAGWRIEGNRSILCGSSASPARRKRWCEGLLGAHVQSASLYGRLPELSLGFSNGRYVASATEAVNQPDWTLFDYRRDPFRWLHVRGGMPVIGLNTRGKELN